MYRSFSTPVPSAATFPDAESVIRDLTQDLCTAFNTGNYDQAAALFSSEGQFMPPQRESATGPRAIERLLRQLGEAGYGDLRLETQRVDRSSDTAIETGSYTVVIRQENGTVIADRGKYLHAWRRIGAWLLIANAWSSSLPPVK